MSGLCLQVRPAVLFSSLFMAAADPSYKDGLIQNKNSLCFHHSTVWPASYITSLTESLTSNQVDEGPASPLYGHNWGNGQIV